MYHKAQRWSTRPSQLLGIDNDYYAYCLDEVVDTFGQYVESELDKITDKNAKKRAQKQKNRLGQILQIDPQHRFRSFRDAGKQGTVTK